MANDHDFDRDVRNQNMLNYKDTVMPLLVEFFTLAKSGLTASNLAASKKILEQIYDLGVNSWRPLFADDSGVSATEGENSLENIDFKIKNRTL